MRQDRLPRFLGPIGAALLAVGWTIGSGIFRVPGQVAAGAGSISASLLLWGGGGLVALCGALCCAELSVRLPRSGGEYVYPFMALALLGAAVLRRKYGPPTGFSMPLYPLPLIVYVGSVIAILAASVADDPMAMVFALSAPVTGSIAYYVGKRRGAFRAVNADGTEP